MKSQLVKCGIASVDGVFLHCGSPSSDSCMGRITFLHMNDIRLTPEKKKERHTSSQLILSDGVDQAHK